MVLEKVNALGIKVFLGTRIRSIATCAAGDLSYATGLVFEDGNEQPFDMVVFAVGIRPRDEIAQVSGILVDPRGGIQVQDDLRTSASSVYALGECASWNQKTYGLISPCNEMADILAFNLTRQTPQKKRTMTTPDTSTKLKLVGVNVASFGDYFADKKPPENVGAPRGRKSTNVPTPIRCLTYHDPFGPVYKKYLFSGDGKYLLGGMMIGDVNDYTKLLSIVKKQVSTATLALNFFLIYIHFGRSHWKYHQVN